jgi:REP element-mobilizing transposase RayT
MHVHLIFVTKYRRKVFTKQILDELKKIFVNICIDFETDLVEFEGEGDHVHLLINYPPKVTISKLVNSLKGVSSRLIRKKQYPSTLSNINCYTSALVFFRLPPRHCLSYSNEYGLGRWRNVKQKNPSTSV